MHFGNNHKKISDFLLSIENEGKMTTAKLIRSLLVDIFNEAIASGIVENNPATITRQAKTKVKSSRLSIEIFNIILDKTKGHPKWVRDSMLIALLTAQRVSDISEMKFSHIVDGYLRIEQKKTRSKVAIPLDITCHFNNLDLKSIIDDCKKLSNSDYILSDDKGKKISPSRISKKFSHIRDSLNLTWEGEPASFHEIRSLAARIYSKEFNSDFAQRILGHKSASMTDKYRDTRGSEWVLV